MNHLVTLAAHSARVPQEWIEGWVEMRAHTALEPLEVVLTAIADEHAVMEFEITDAARQPMGLLHGGVSLLVSESVASLHAAWLCDLTRVAPVGVDINGTHIRSTREGRVRVTARVVRKTRAFVFHEVDVELVSEAAPVLLSKVRITDYFRPHGE